MVDPVADPVVDAVADPVLDPVADPVVDPVVDPLVDPVVDMVVDPGVDPVATFFLVAERPPYLGCGAAPYRSRSGPPILAAERPPPRIGRGAAPLSIDRVSGPPTRVYLRPRAAIALSSSVLTQTAPAPLAMAVRGEAAPADRPQVLVRPAHAGMRIVTVHFYVPMFLRKKNARKRAGYSGIC